MPAFFAVTRTVTMTDGFTLRKRMKMIWSRLTGALERIDCHHSQNALQMNPKMRSAMMATMNRMMRSRVIMQVTSQGGVRGRASCRAPGRVSSRAAGHVSGSVSHHVPGLAPWALTGHRHRPARRTRWGPSMRSTITFAPRPRLPLCTCTSHSPSSKRARPEGRAGVTMTPAAPGRTPTVSAW